MFGKFVFAFIAVCCIAQGLEARSFSPLSLDDVLNSIKQLIKKVTDAMSKLPQLIADLQAKIKQIIEQLNIPGMLVRIEEEAKKIMQAAGVDIVAAAHCIADITQDVKNLEKEATNEINKCAEGAEAAEQSVEALVASLTKEAEQIIADLQAEADQCVKDNGIDIAEVVKCLEGLLEPATQKINEFVKDVEAAVEKANEIIGDAANTMTDCMTGVGHDIQTKETQILDNFEVCVNEIIEATTQG